MSKKILVFVGEGVGNIIQAIPTLTALNEIGYTVDVALRSNFVGVKNILKLPEINQVFNVYVEKIPEPKSYEKIVLTMFGHIESYKGWKEEFDGIEVIQDNETSKNLGKMNDVELNFRLARELGYEGMVPPVKISYPHNSTFQYFDNIICPGSGGENKRWPYFIEMAKELKGRVGIVGGPSEEKLPWPPNCVDMTGLLDLDEVAAIISKASLYIGNDSGISHLANATGTPCVILWGPSNVVKSRPWNKNLTIVSKHMPCQPCFMLQSETKCEKKQLPNECLNSISIKEVIEAVEKTIENSPYRNDDEYKKHWEKYKKTEEASASDDGNIEEMITDTFEENGIKGETCLDFGCGDGRFIPVLNKFFKNVEARDIIDYDVPELTGVNFINVTSDYINTKKYDCIFLSRIISTGTIDKFLDSIKGNFKTIVIVDYMKDLNKETKRTIPINIEVLQEKLGVELIVEKEEAVDGKNVSVLVGVCSNEQV